MTPEQIKLITESWSHARQRPVVQLFYERLFELDPALEDLFLNSLPVQQEKFNATLSLIIDHIADAEALAPTVQALGVQHAGYGVRPEHYDLVHTALLSALGQTLGDRFDAATAQAWSDAYHSIARAMQMADIESLSHPT